MRRVSIDAPAKINLHLEVGGKRPDGFHNIMSLFQSISLFDYFKVTEFDTKKGFCDLRGAFPCSKEDNLIFKAVEAFREKYFYRNDLLIEVDKNIPHEAGLGGGSSDAAAILKCLAFLVDLDEKAPELIDLAASLGSDIPFFFYGASAIVSGRGEIVEPFELSKTYKGLLVKPSSFGISTKEAYKKVDQYLKENLIKEKSLNVDEIRDYFLKMNPRQWPFYNTFMETLKNFHKPLAIISNLLYYADADFIGLSGSGSTVFSLFENEGLIDGAKSEIDKKFSFSKTFEMLHGNPRVLVI